MRLTNLLHPILNNSAGRPSRPDGHQEMIGTTSHTPFSRVEKYFLHNLNTTCGAFTKFQFSPLQEEAPGLEPSVRRLAF